MHELSLCRSLVGMIEDQAAVHQYNRVRTVHLELGTLCCVEAEALRFSFDAVTRGTLAEGATLDITETRPGAWCRPCGHSVSVARRSDPCPACGGYKLTLSGGDELRLKQLEVD